jgi:anaerobic magnesium-protoporphyrin IX monomethyl ester cyclase
MRVAIVYPEILDMARYRERRKEFPPFGALYIAAALEAEGIEVRVFKLNPDELVHDFRGFDAVAFSISASAAFNMFMECRFNSSFDPDTLLMAGGVHANLLPEQTLLDLEVGVVGIGEGERTILEILEKAPQKKFSEVPGVCYLANGIPTRTAPRQATREIDEFRFPARHLLDPADFVMNDRVSDTSVRMTHIMPGRGCPFPCRYCASAQTKVQYRTGANIRAELVHLIEKYAIQGFAVVGNDFILSKKNVRDICDSIRDLNLVWATLTRVDRVDRDLLSIMRDGGCYELEYGVESGSQRILDLMDKRVTVAQIHTALQEAYKAGIKNKVFLVHGFPGEDRESTEETMKLLDTVGGWIHRVSLFRFVPLPGTFVYNNPQMFGVHGIDTDPSWDGDWGKYHIHHNNHHWWGTESDFQEQTASYRLLRDYVESRWPSRFSPKELPPDKWESQSKSYVKGRHGTEVCRVPRLRTATATATTAF